MPFINDLVANNLKRIEENSPEETDTRVNRKIVSRFVFFPVKVMSLLRSRIIGQDEVLDSVEEMLKVVKADIGAKDRPLTVNLFLGPTGVGKTEIVRLIAKAIHGHEDEFCRIDMNTLAQEHYAAALTGAPPGYVGSKEGVSLFNEDQVKGSFSKPGIVLFDELEKASKEVIRSLLNVLENGKLILSSGNKTIDFRNCMIFMTSNIGAKNAWQYRNKRINRWKRKIGWDGEKKVVDNALHDYFDPEFLNRIDRILCFNRIEEEWLGNILDIELEKLNSRLDKLGMAVSLTETARTYLSTGHDARFGARAIGRKVRTVLEPVIADYLLHTIDSGNNIITVNYHGTHLFVKKLNGENTYTDENEAW
ncbi:MAG: AAA family ATPase [Candidatus Azobacteroides sp.]|nr:AAA family ATPase [Candidatus Azobacteroides sp.]